VFVDAGVIEGLEENTIIGVRSASRFLGRRVTWRGLDAGRAKGLAA
jgi:hypothetical protein